MSPDIHRTEIEGQKYAALASDIQGKLNDLQVRSQELLSEKYEAMQRTDIITKQLDTRDIKGKEVTIYYIPERLVDVEYIKSILLKAGTVVELIIDVNSVGSDRIHYPKTKEDYKKAAFQIRSLTPILGNIPISDSLSEISLYVRIILHAVRVSVLGFCE